MMIGIFLQFFVVLYLSEPVNWRRTPHTFTIFRPPFFIYRFPSSAQAVRAFSSTSIAVLANPISAIEKWQGTLETRLVNSIASTIS